MVQVETDLGTFNPTLTPRGIGVGAYIATKIDKPIEELHKEFSGLMYEATKWRSQTMYMDASDVSAAATRIQAGYRGKKGRRRAKGKKPKTYTQEEERAALSIQAGARGRKAHAVFARGRRRAHPQAPERSPPSASAHTGATSPSRRMNSVVNFTDYHTLTAHSTQVRSGTL